MKAVDLIFTVFLYSCVLLPMPIFNLFYKEVLLIVLRCNVFFCFGEQTFYINIFF